MRAVLLVVLAAALALAMHPVRAAVISTDETLWHTEREQLSPKRGAVGELRIRGVVRLAF